MTDVCGILERRPSFRRGDGVPVSSIDIAEGQLGLHFAKDYRAYLSAFGTVRYYGHELTGLNCPRYLDVVAATHEGREVYSDVPTDYYVIEETHVDGITYWQDSSGAVYLTVPNSRPTKCYASLAQYVLDTAVTV